MFSRNFLQQTHMKTGIRNRYYSNLLQVFINIVKSEGIE